MANTVHGTTIYLNFLDFSEKSGSGSTFLIILTLVFVLTGSFLHGVGPWKPCLIIINLIREIWLNLVLKMQLLSDVLFLDSSPTPWCLFSHTLTTVPAILHEAIPATTQHIDSQLQIAQEQAFRYTAILEKVTKNPLLAKELESYMLKEALYNIRQYEIFLQTVLVS